MLDTSPQILYTSFVVMVVRSKGTPGPHVFGHGPDFPTIAPVSSARALGYRGFGGIHEFSDLKVRKKGWIIDRTS